jgi:release factor glutamine methyltransferase
MVTNKIGEQSVGETLTWLISRLEKTSDTAGLDAQVLLARLIHTPRSWVVAHPEALLSRTSFSELELMVSRLEQGEPLPYVLGTWEFFGLEFELTSAVLIPRPETELLVERAIMCLRKPGVAAQDLNALDIGTGSGCIAISLAVNLQGLSITATDISNAALNVARRNAEKLNVSGRITFLEADLFSNPLIVGPFSLIVANPPYIPTDTLHMLPIYGHEPNLALDGGPDGLDLIRRILKESPSWLTSDGLLLMEIEASQGIEMLSLASEIFPKARILLHKDLAGHDRLLEIQK